MTTEDEYPPVPDGRVHVSDVPPEVARVVDRHPFKFAEGGPVSADQATDFGDPPEYFRPFSSPPGWTKIADGDGVRVVDKDGDILAEGGVVWIQPVDPNEAVRLTVTPPTKAQLARFVEDIKTSPIRSLPTVDEYPRLGDRVHYVSKFDGMCKAAIVADVDKSGRRNLLVITSEGNTTTATDVPRDESFTRSVWVPGSYHTYQH